jgi:lipid II:glycine glycyltransferase (peptidoglycan interpeptide bridge formation enzyme)
LLLASVARRGGEVTATESTAALHQALVGADVGRLAQARLGGEVVASVLVLLAPDGGYLHSSGNSDPGRSVGAPHLLVHEIALQLKREGRSVLNLGGTRDDETGLKTFKNHFGASEVAADAGAIDTQGLVGRLGSGVSAVLARLKRLGR